MEKRRKIEKVGRRIHLKNEGMDDIYFWAEQDITFKMKEGERMRRFFYELHYGVYPEKMEKTGRKFIKEWHDKSI